MKKIVVKIPSLWPQWIYDGNLAKIAVAKAKTKCMWYKTGQKNKKEITGLWVCEMKHLCDRAYI